MAENRTTFEVWTWPHNGDAFTQKFPITAYVTDYEFSAEYGVGGGDGVLHLDPTFARLTEILNRDYATPANDHASIIVVHKDGIPYRPYVAARLPKTISSEATSVPLTLRSMAYFLDKARVGPFDHNPLVADSVNPNPTLDPDWEYGAESVLRFGDSISNEVQQIWRSTGMSSGTFTLKQSNNATQSSSVPWNATAAQMKTAAEELPDVVEVTVSGDGTDVAPWEFEFLDPSGNVAFTLEIGTNSTNGVFSTDTLREGGSLDPSPWTQSQNPVTKVVHGNYQTFDIVDNTIAPAAAFPAGDTYVLRIDVDSLGEVGTDYGGAQQIVQVEGGSRWRAGCYVYSPGEAKRFRIVVRSMDEATAFNSKDFDVPADTLFFLDMPAINIPKGVSEVIYRIGILEPTNVGVAYIAIQSAILAPGFPPRPWGYIVNDLKVDIGFRTSLFDWVTTTWTLTNDSSGVAWDRDLSWTINLRQSLQQLCEISHEWGYESTGIYWSEANSRFEWGCYNPGNGGVDRTATGFKIGMGDALMFGERVSRVPETTEAWAFGTNMKWGRATDATMVSKWGVLESMALDRQGQDTMDVLAAQMVQDSELESAVQKIRVHFARITPGIDFDIGDYINVDMGPVGVVGTFRVAGIVEGKTEDGEEYADIHLGALVKTSEVAQADAVRTMWRKLEVMEGREVGSRVVEPAQTIPTPTGGKGRPVIVAASNAPDDWKDAADYVCDGVDDDVEIEAAATAGHATGAQHFFNIQLSPGDFFTDTAGGTGILLSKSDGGILRGAGQWVTVIHGISTGTLPNTRDILTVGNKTRVSDLSFADDSYPSGVDVYGIGIQGSWVTVENVYGFTNGHLIRITGGNDNFRIKNVAAESNKGILNIAANTSRIYVDKCKSTALVTSGGDFGNISIASGCTEVFISNCSINVNSSSPTADAIRVRGQDILISNCWLRQNTSAGAGFGGAGVSIVQSGTLRVSIVGCHFSANNGGIGIHVREPAAGSADVTGLIVAGNMFYGNLRYGIKMDPDDCTINQGVIADNYFSLGILGLEAISLDGTLASSVLHTVIADNTFLWAATNTDAATVFSIKLIDGRGCIVSGNQIDNFHNVGIYAEDCPDLSIFGNHLLLSRTQGRTCIQVVDCENVFVSGNRIRMSVDPAATTDAILVEGTYTEGTVIGNRVRGPASATNARYGVNPSTASGSGLVVAGNDVRGSWATAPINVTNSPIVSYPAHATYGDNFT